jgi:predicted phage-related endonuclease
MSHDATFYENRSKCIGGSDVPDLLDLDPFGCSRRLWYAKRGVPEDFPFVETNQVRRGSLIEDVAIDEFCRTHGYRATTNAPPAHMTHPKYPYLGAHVDRFVVRIGSNDEAVLENKIPNLRNFMAIKSGGPSQTAVAQTRWNMMVADVPFGIISVFNADRFESLKFDIRRDPTIESQFITIGTAFWGEMQANVVNPFPQKPEGAAVCLRCQWRKTCKGMGATSAVILSEEEAIDISAKQWSMDDAIQPLIVAVIEARQRATEAKAEKEEAEAALDKAMDGRNIVTPTGHRAYWKVTVQNWKAQPAKPAEQKKQRSLKVIEP